MISILQEEKFKGMLENHKIIAPCLLQGIGPDPIKGSIIERIPLTIGDRTVHVLHSVCIAPINIPCILGIDLLKPLGAIIDFGTNSIIIENEKFPLKIKTNDHGCNVYNVKRVVIPPNSVGFLDAKLEKALPSGYLVEPNKFKSCLLSSVYGEDTQRVKLKVVNDSESYRLFKRDIFLGQAEPAIKLGNDDVKQDDQVNSSTLNQGSMPEHLADMYKNSSSNLDEGQKKKFKDLLIEFQSVFSRDDFDLGCFKDVEHKIVTTDQTPVKEKFRRTPLKFQQQEKEYILTSSCNKVSLSPRPLTGRQHLFWSAKRRGI